MAALARIVGVTFVFTMGALATSACGNGFSSAPSQNGEGTAGSGTGGAAPSGGAGGAEPTGGSGASPGGAGASPGGAGGSGGGTQCDPGASPDEDSCVVTDDLGVFVSPTGTGSGTMAAPYGSIAEAIENAGGKRVYVCAGDYSEALRIEAGVELWGGFDCGDWSYSTDGARARIVPGDAEPVVATGADGLELHDVAIVAADASNPGGSSIALQLFDSDAVLERVELTAGEGAAGESPALVGYTYPEIAELAGCDATDATGDCAISECTFTCPGGDTTIGGGRGSISDGGGPGSPTGSANGGAAPSPSCNIGGKGDDGAAGADGNGASSHGTLSSTGWAPAAGVAGGNGKVGQGGGGGSGGDGSGRGGGGGCGGCGGKGAPASTGGGSSIALLSFGSQVALSGATLTTDAAGTGGDAQPGQPGQLNPGSTSVAGFGGVQQVPGCPGGNGGVGGDGGASGGGAGGLSVGILHNGGISADVESNNTITTGSAGDGGAPVSGNPGTAGIAGVAQPVLDVS